jgi:hypothetical protein
MRTFFALCFLCVGVWTIHSGWSKKQSLAGKTEATIAQIGRHIDGESRVPEHIWYLAGGTVLGLAGLGLLFAGGKRS